MTITTLQLGEKLSALFDGQPDSAGSVPPIQPMLGVSDLEATWMSYQLIGQAMRGEVDDPLQASTFLANFERRLANEGLSQAVATARSVSDGAIAASNPMLTGVKKPQKSHARNRWTAITALAGVVLSGAMGLGLLQQTAMVQVAVAPDLSKLAPTSNAQPVFVTAKESDQSVMIRDAALDELLLAHQLQGGHSALQMPSGFLRNATFERPTK